MTLNMHYVYSTSFLKFTPLASLNRVHPVKFTSVTAKRISLGHPLGVQPGWNVYPACPVGRNYRTGVKFEDYLIGAFNYFTGVCPVKFTTVTACQVKFMSMTAKRI